MTRRRVVLAALAVLIAGGGPAGGQPIIIDHHDTDLAALSQAEMQRAKDALHIAYGHTSHGSQVTSGMTGLVGFANGGGKGLSLPTDFLAWNNGGAGGALDLHDYAMGGDVGYYPQWVNNTRTYLDNPANADVNVIMWSWCGQASWYTETQMLDQFLTPMTTLAGDYPDVTFVYMTGHTDGTGLTGNLHLRNEQIRDYCQANNKVLFDFADIESWDPDGNWYGDKLVNDNCDYDSDGNGSRDRNWATDWQGSHTLNVDWYSCSSAHSQALNANQKAYAAWAMFSEIAKTMVPLHDGDCNGDDRVDVYDLAALANHYALPGTQYRADGDLNGDHIVNVFDLALLANNYGWTAGGSTVPEPATLILLCGAAAAALPRRRRRR